MHRSGSIRLHRQTSQQRALAVHAQVLAGAVRRSEGAALRIERARTDLEEIEIQLLLEGIRLCYGYDFREYALSPLRRGLTAAMAREGVQTVSAYQDRILHDAACMQRFLGTVGFNVTGMFRDPELMRCVREEVGSYPLDRVRRYEDAYAASGGQANLADHYSIAGRAARFNRKLQGSITWARHSLVTDGSFNDFHLIVCANVLIYFRASLQERAHRLMYDSLIRGGFLALGKRESLLHCPDRDHYEQVRDGVNLFRKMRW
ncbi:MAG: hypothetical protein E6I35_00540 [Chloroflexi bacterium]|nr:MAG: hypothetical protein E6I35_00540 [Chloroflexota bacterium]